MSDIDYLAVPYQVALEVPQTVMNNDTMTAVIQWFVTNVLTSHPLAGGVAAHWQMNWFDISDNSFAALRAAAPDLAYIKRTIHGSRMFLQLMELQQVKTVAKKAVISTSILAAHPTAEECCASYYTVAAPRPPDLGLYDQLVFVLSILRSRVTFLERRVIIVIDMLVIYDEFSRSTDPMPSYLVELDMGVLSLLEAKQYMRQAYTI